MSLPQTGSLIAGKYRLEAPLGEGGMGAVFRARHELMGKPVALKWLKPASADEAQSQARFLQEARAAARIQHPNVVDVYDVGSHEGGLFMVMELLEGHTFAELLRDGQAQISTALRHLLEAMSGVASAHAAGIIHRDIKPENIFVAYDQHYTDGIAKILDFGISKLHDDTRIARTRPGTAMGTPHYMPFEQMNGESDLDQRADVYAFGVLLYRTLTGVLPFEGRTFSAILLQCAGARPRSPKQLCPEIPTALDRVVMKAIALRREDRFATMEQLIDAVTRSSSLNSPRSWAAARLPGTSSVRTMLDAEGTEPGRSDHRPVLSTPPASATEGKPARTSRRLIVWALGAGLAIASAAVLYTVSRDPGASEAGASRSHDSQSAQPTGSTSTASPAGSTSAGSTSAGSTSAGSTSAGSTSAASPSAGSTSAASPSALAPLPPLAAALSSAPRGASAGAEARVDGGLREPSPGQTKAGTWVGASTNPGTGARRSPVPLANARPVSPSVPATKRSEQVSASAPAQPLADAPLAAPSPVVLSPAASPGARPVEPPAEADHRSGKLGLDDL